MIHLIPVLALVFGNAAHASIPDSLRVVSFNAFNRLPHRAARFEKASRAIWNEQPDVVFLQEIGHGLILWGDALDWIWKGRPEPEAWDRVWEWQESNWGIYKNGMAILSRFPILEHRYEEMTASNAWDLKGLLVAEVLVNGEPATFVNVHLRSTSSWDVKKSEFEQLGVLTERWKQRGHVVVAGDFNWDWGDPDYRAAIRRHGGKSLYDGLPEGRYSTWTPHYGERCDELVETKTQQQLDNILLYAGNSQAPATRETAPAFLDAAVNVPLARPTLSDHCLLFAEVRLKPIARHVTSAHRRAK